MDLDLDIDLNMKDFYKVPINGLAKQSQSKSKKYFNIKSETEQLDQLIKQPPEESENFKFISVSGGFSSIAFIKYIAERETINDLFVSTLTVGKKHINILNDLYTLGKLKNANFVIGTIFKQSNTADYKYFDIFEEICNKNNWKFKQVNNHSKLILMKTNSNYYVLETSSNLNENPKIEFFNFENDKETYNFYNDFFNEVLKLDD